MSFSTGWDDRYQESQHLSLWPWSDLVSLVMRHSRVRDGESCSVLELGCGAGANLPFFQALGVNYHGLDGSRHIVHQIHQKYPSLRRSVLVADFCRELPFDGPFDLVVDRAALTHNPSTAIRSVLKEVRRCLRPGGKFIGVDWFGCGHTEAGRGVATEDEFTRTGYESGPFAGVGSVHFSDRPHLEDLFEGYKFEVLERKVLDQQEPEEYRQVTWNLVAVVSEESP